MQAIATAFEKFNKKHNSCGTIVFIPEIKIKREKDTLYISMLRKTKLNSLIATVEVHNGSRTDKAPMPVTLLNDVEQREIVKRLQLQLV